MVSPRALALAVGAALASAGPAGAEGCRLALALGFDVSRSVSDSDYAIQRDGIILALKTEAIRAAFLATPEPVMLAIFEWSGRRHQEWVLGWTPITSGADLDAVAALMAAHQREPLRRSTALGTALIFAWNAFANGPDCTRRTLDLSGDGQYNDGTSPQDVYRQYDFADITVNGLAIADHESNILRYYQTRVIRGPGAFAMEARHFTDFPEIFARKLLRELSEALLGQAETAGRPGNG